MYTSLQSPFHCFAKYFKGHCSSHNLCVPTNMEFSCLHSKKVSFSFFSALIVLLCMITSSVSAEIPTYANETDRLALLEFKNHITQDPLKIMSSWNDSIHFCNWAGVTCSSSNGRVVILNLEGQRLGGSIPPSMGNLTFLTGINLINNSFRGEIPQDLGRLLNLQHLNLSTNFFGGKIPANLSHCTELTVLNVITNNLVGNIPDQLSSLSKLAVFGLAGNNLTGSIPAWIGNFSSLLTLSLALNNFQGSIPTELGLLSSLRFFQLYGNNLSGTIPSSIYNISSIYFFSVTQNKLHGQLPPDIGLTLPKLEFFACALNNFTGPIPVSLSNASKLQTLDIGPNGFMGSVPKNLGSLRGLVRLDIEANRLGNGQAGDLDFLSSLANLTSLEVLGLNGNLFGGELPDSIANLTTKLKILTMGSNLIHGRIPNGIGNLVGLTGLGLEKNYFSGSAPDVLGKLPNLEKLYLDVNNFSGPIPSSLGNLTRLISLFLEENKFEGSIPPHLGNCQYLQIINLTKNSLNGSIPKEIIGLSSLISLAMSQNSLGGSLPSEIGNLNHLVDLDVSKNQLSGKIPTALGSCVSLQSLHLQGNTLEGTIPQSMENLRGLQDLDLSHNNLSGLIPEFFSEFMFLTHLNLSYNDFEGEVSKEGIFRNGSAISVTGNDKLCGGVPELGLPTCSSKSQQGHRDLKVLIPTISGVLLVVLLSSFVGLQLLKRSSGHSVVASPGETHEGISYSEVLKSTNGFCEENLIGSGSFGSVYKGFLSCAGRVVAIKVINQHQRGASKSFIDECYALRSIRHRNILSVITVCSTVDHRGNDFKCLVFEFMPNGSLDQWLPEGVHEKSQIKKLSFTQRLNMAIHVASALDYLHHHCQTPIVHCDLKPSNVLLNEDMTAHVGDFGLAKILFKADDFKNQTITSRLKGSIGYMPPEYGMCGQVSTQGDVYSYGILLLEMFTGKRPTDDTFKENEGIHKFTKLALPECVMEVVDTSMLFEEEEDDDDKDHDQSEKNDYATIRKEECLVSVLRIALSCSATSPSKRMPMNLVVNKLQEVKDSFLKTKHRNGRRM